MDLIDNNTNDDSSKSMFSFNYYRQYFNVTTEDILVKIRSTLSFRESRAFFSNSQQEIFGSIWVPITSSFITLICGQLFWIVRGKSRPFHLSTGIYITCLLFAFTFAYPLLYRAISKASSPPAYIALCSLFGYGVIYLVPLSILRLIIWKKISFILISLFGGISSYSLFVKLDSFHNDFDSKKKMFMNNIILMGANFLLVVIVEYIAFK